MDNLSSFKISIVSELPEKVDKDQLYLITDDNSTIWYKDYDETSWINIDSCNHYPTIEKKYFFPTNCVNCGNILDKEGHCDCCGAWHNPTMVI